MIGYDHNKLVKAAPRGRLSTKSHDLLREKTLQIISNEKSFSSLSPFYFCEGQPFTD